MANWSSRSATIGMLELPVAPLGLAEQAKAHALQCTHELAGLDHGSARRRHAATSIRFTPMISAWRGMSAPRAFKSARQSAITSRMFLMASSYVRPCV